MIAADTSTLIAYLSGDKGKDVESLDDRLALGQVCLPPVVVTEILSAPKAIERLGGIVRALPILAVGDGYWERAGQVRRRLLARGLKAALADSLICQSCLDYDVPLLTRDGDFQSFARYCGLRLA